MHVREKWDRDFSVRSHRRVGSELGFLEDGNPEHIARSEAIISAQRNRRPRLQRTRLRVHRRGLGVSTGECLPSAAKRRYQREGKKEEDKEPHSVLGCGDVPPRRRNVTKSRLDCGFSTKTALVTRSVSLPVTITFDWRKHAESLFKEPEDGHPCRGSDVDLSIHDHRRDKLIAGPKGVAPLCCQAAVVKLVGKIGGVIGMQHGRMARIDSRAQTIASFVPFEETLGVAPG